MNGRKMMTAMSLRLCQSSHNLLFHTLQEEPMFHTQTDILDFMKINLHFGAEYQENIDDAMKVFHTNRINIYGKQKLDRIALIIQAAAIELYKTNQ